MQQQRAEDQFRAELDQLLAQNRYPASEHLRRLYETELLKTLLIYSAAHCLEVRSHVRALIQRNLS
jgi:hypothetical protein